MFEKQDEGLVEALCRSTLFGSWNRLDPAGTSCWLFWPCSGKDPLQGYHLALTDVRKSQKSLRISNISKYEADIRVCRGHTKMLTYWKNFLTLLAYRLTVTSPRVLLEAYNVITSKQISFLCPYSLTQLHKVNQEERNSSRPELIDKE